MKVLLPQDAETEQPADAVGPHTAHVSRNARRIRADGQAEWFVTQRSRGVGGQDAARQPTELLDRLDGYPILSVEREFVIYDSNESIDEGWIE